MFLLCQTLKSLKVRVSVIGLSAEVRVCTVLTRETGGSYHVILDESHFKELLMLHVKPPPASSSSECSLIRMGQYTEAVFKLTANIKHIRATRTQVLKTALKHTIWKFCHKGTLSQNKTTDVSVMGSWELLFSLLNNHPLNI